MNEVIDRSGDKAQTIATDAKYSEFQFSRIRSCQSGTLDFVDRLPLDLQREIARRWAERLGFTVIDPSPAELSAQLFDAIDQLVQTARVARRVVDITNARIRAGAR